MAQLRLHSDPAPPIVRLHWLIELNIELAVEYRNSYRVTLSEQTALSPAARDEFRPGHAERPRGSPSYSPSAGGTDHSPGMVTSRWPPTSSSRC